MYKTFEYKLRPNAEQTRIFAETLKICRNLYNGALFQRSDAYKYEGVSFNFFKQVAQLKHFRAKAEPLRNIYYQVAKEVYQRLDKAFQNFFRRVKAGETPGYPRFKGINQYDSFKYPSWTSTHRIENNRINLPKIGQVKMFYHRLIEGTPKQCAVKKKADGWYIAIICEVDAAPLPATGEEVGIDVGIENFATLSTGEQIPNPKLLRKAERKLKTAQRKVSRRKKGSQRRRAAVTLLAKQHQTVKRARLDFAHKTANSLIERFDTIAVEDLQIRNMVRNHHLAKSISDAGWGTFVNILSFKAESAGRIVTKVNPAYTSQDCSGCGERVPKKLSQRKHICPHCGLELHRDTNAARNIIKKGSGRPCGDSAAIAAEIEPQIIVYHQRKGQLLLFL